MSLKNLLNSLRMALKDDKDITIEEEVEYAKSIGTQTTSNVPLWFRATKGNIVEERRFTDFEEYITWAKPLQQEDYDLEAIQSGNQKTQKLLQIWVSTMHKINYSIIHCSSDLSEERQIELSKWYSKLSAEDKKNVDAVYHEGFREGSYDTDME